MTFVTHDRRTIPPLLKTWAEEAHSHAGKIFVDAKTISWADIGGQIKSLGVLVKQMRTWDWTDRTGLFSCGDENIQSRSALLSIRLQNRLDSNFGVGVLVARNRVTPSTIFDDIFRDHDAFLTGFTHQKIVIFSIRYQTEVSVNNPI